jgi:hypothetical protein
VALTTTYSRSARCGAATDLTVRVKKSTIAGMIAAACMLASAANGQTAPETNGSGAGWWANAGDHVDFSALFQMESAIDLRDGGGQKLEVQLEPELNIALPKDLDLTLIGRIRSDLLDNLEPGDPHQADVFGPTRRLFLGDRVEFELREAYLDADIGNAYLRVGKQQLVWGTADGLKVLDVVNPQDYREFILDTFDESRIPLWSVNLEVPVGGVTAQFIWIPDTTVNRIPRDGTYEITSGLPRRLPGVRVIEEIPERPDHFISDSDIGVRLSTFFKGWDLTFSYLYRYDDFPVLYRSINVLPWPTATISPRYERSHLIGTTFSNAFGNLTLRGELAYSMNKHYSTNNLLDGNGVFESDEFAYVLGFDWFGFTNTFLSLQVFQNFLMDDQAGSVRDSVDTNLTFTARRTFRNETVTAEMIWLQNINHGDGLIRPKISYDVRDDLTVWAGIDFFYGSSQGVFGQFDHNDRVTTGFEWAF